VPEHRVTKPYVVQLTPRIVSSRFNSLSNCHLPAWEAFKFADNGRMQTNALAITSAAGDAVVWQRAKQFCCIPAPKPVLRAMLYGVFDKPAMGLTPLQLHKVFTTSTRADKASDSEISHWYNDFILPEGEGFDYIAGLMLFDVFGQALELDDWLESTSDDGSEFWIAIPASIHPQQAATSSTLDINSNSSVLSYSVRACRFHHFKGPLCVAQALLDGQLQVGLHAANAKALPRSPVLLQPSDMVTYNAKLFTCQDGCIISQDSSSLRLNLTGEITLSDGRQVSHAYGYLRPEMQRWIVKCQGEDHVVITRDGLGTIQLPPSQEPEPRGPSTMADEPIRVGQCFPNGLSTPVLLPTAADPSKKYITWFNGVGLPHPLAC